MVEVWRKNCYPKWWRTIFLVCCAVGYYDNDDRSAITSSCRAGGWVLGSGGWWLQRGVVCSAIAAVILVCHCDFPSFLSLPPPSC